MSVHRAKTSKVMSGSKMSTKTVVRAAALEHRLCSKALHGSMCFAVGARLAKKPPAGIALVRKLGTLVPSTGRWAWLCIDRDWLNKRFQVPAFSMPALLRLLQNAAWTRLA